LGGFSGFPPLFFKPLLARKDEPERRPHEEQDQNHPEHRPVPGNGDGLGNDQRQHDGHDREYHQAQDVKETIRNHRGSSLLVKYDECDPKMQLGAL
jgi:hypothetical protein